jgi:hypothetical protein
VLISSSLRGNFAIARWPSFSMTDAFGRAPPREEPGAEQLKYVNYQLRSDSRPVIDVDYFRDCPRPKITLKHS